jgi:deoxyribodipyrimidine photo-lyase
MNHLVWFRNDLRIADNASLSKACDGNKVIAVYCFDPNHFKTDVFGFKKTEKYRAKFLLETVSNLKENLKALNIPLLVYHDDPKNTIPKIISEYQIGTVFLQREWTQEEIDSLESVKKNCKANVSFNESYDQFLFHPEDIHYKEFYQIPEIFTEFRKSVEKLSKVRPPLAVPKAMLAVNLIENKTILPSLNQLGLQEFEPDSRSAFPFMGGEVSALGRLDYYFWETKKLGIYKKTRNGLVGTDYSSKFSPWLANGSISARTIYEQIKLFEKQVMKNQDTYWLIFELIWRDYFKYFSLKHGNTIFKIGGILKKEYSWNTSEEKKIQWISGTTKQPFVNANMIELAKTGWMSNRGRQNVASFWAKEWCMDWRIGAGYFESMLIDYDVHSNWGNWMYNSGVGNDPRDRKFNVEQQAETYDPNGTYQKLWLQNRLF